MEFTVIVNEIKTALTYFNFIKSAESVVDYNLLTLQGEPLEPLALIGTNGVVIARVCVSAKIDAPFAFRVDLNIFKGIVGASQDDVLRFEVKDDFLYAHSGTVKHKLAQISKPLQFNYKQDLFGGKQILLNDLKGLRSYETTYFVEDGLLALNGSYQMTFIPQKDFNIACYLSATQITFLDNFASIKIQARGDKLYVSDDVCQAVLQNRVKLDVPDYHKVLNLPTILEFTITADEAKALKGFSYADELYLIADKGTLTVLARSGKQESRWEKAVKGKGMIKLPPNCLSSIVGNIGLVALSGNYTALKIKNGNAVTFITGLVR